MTSNLNLFEHLSLKEEGIVRTSSGAEELKIKGNGTIKLNNDSGKIVLHNVLYVPDLAVNLLSVRSIIIDGYSVKFEMNHFSITNTSGLIMSGKYVNNLPTLMFANVEHSSNLSSSEALHKSLGHQNGLAERFNRTLLESMRATLQDTGLNKRLWNEIIKTSALVLNQIPSHKSKSSPYKLFKGRSLPLSFFKPIGMKLTYYILPERSKSKTLTKGEMGSLIGFNDELRSYKVYGENGRIIDTKHVQFLDFPDWKHITTNDDEDLIIGEDDDGERSAEGALEDENNQEVESLNQEESSDDGDEEVELNLAPPHSRTLRERGPKIKPVKYSYLAGDPTSFKMAMKCKQQKEWINAADEELNNIEGHDVWEDIINFKQSTADPCLYIHQERHSYIFFHVDDLVVIGNVNKFEALFLKQFPNSSAHEPDTLLGMDLTYDEKSVSLSQKKLIKKGLEMAGMLECRPVKTPLAVGIRLKDATEQEKDEFNKLKINYCSHTGILNYLACRTRPDLAAAVSILSSFNNAPGINHWRQIVHCWKYLAGTIDLKLVLRPDQHDNSNEIKHYTDATWADNLETQISRSGSICFWKACPISWNSKKQHNITLSLTEADMNSLADGVQENQWIKYVIEELYNKSLKPTQFLIDNKGLLDKINKFGSNSKTKHLDIKAK
ncbi:hypothetical protein VP01_1314g6 [Puccinia sorghi]|uniref:Retrovirus-related Pol polyprotein from transposon TNT 1-94-like beta-barrel domain-containing protein n=1 Tax=Puccinia sorghi TaxID=27349 RepID=A0A0L6VMV0_9BASI|nr:hypothetical protein VP01_1314g6 [Puccinia sorghi]